MVHLVYCDDKPKELSKILDGSKTMVIRGAAGRKIPHSRVFVSKELYFMEKGSKKITAKAVVKDVQNFAKLTDDEITKTIEDRYIFLSILPITLGIIPLIAFCFTASDLKELNGILFGMAIMGMVSVYPDLYNIFHILKAVPKNATIQNHKNETYYFE